MTDNNEEENLLEQFEDPEAIGRWLLSGFQNWANYDQPWIKAFPPLSLHDELYLERQLVEQLSQYSSESPQCLIKALLYALNQWRVSTADQNTVDNNASRTLKGLLNMVVEVKQITPFKTIFWQLLTETPQAISLHLKIINILATLAPDPVAMALLRNFRQEEQWKPSFAPLCYIANISNKPENWAEDLGKFRGDFNSDSNKNKDHKSNQKKLIKETLLPHIFYAYIVNTLGLSKVSEHLHQLVFNTIYDDVNRNSIPTPDQWFIEALLGRTDSPLFALRNDQSKWYLTKAIDYPTGEKIVIEKTNKELERYFKVYNSDIRCEDLTTKLVELFVEDRVEHKVFEKAINELSTSFNKHLCLYFVELAIQKLHTITSKKKQLILGTFEMIGNAPKQQNLTYNDILVLMTVHSAETKGCRDSLTKHNVYGFLKEKQPNLSFNNFNEIIHKLKQNGFILDLTVGLKLLDLGKGCLVLQNRVLQKNHETFNKQWIPKYNEYRNKNNVARAAIKETSLDAIA